MRALVFQRSDATLVLVREQADAVAASAVDHEPLGAVDIDPACLSPLVAQGVEETGYHAIVGADSVRVRKALRDRT